MGLLVDTESVSVVAFHLRYENTFQVMQEMRLSVTPTEASN